MIDWKSIPKIDAHIHLLPPDVIENNRGNDPGAPGKGPGTKKFWA